MVHPMAAVGKTILPIDNPDSLSLMSIQQVAREIRAHFTGSIASFSSGTSLVNGNLRAGRMRDNDKSSVRGQSWNVAIRTDGELKWKTVRPGSGNERSILIGEAGWI